MFCNVFPLNKSTDVPAELVELLMFGVGTAYMLPEKEEDWANHCV